MPISADTFLDTDPWADPHGTIAKVLGAGQISSARRSAAHNAQVGGSPTSSHLTAQAVDWVPADGDTAMAAQKLASAGLPFDQIRDEGDHLHVGFGPQMRGQVTAAPHTQKADAFLGPPKVDDFLGAPPPAKAPVAPIKHDAVPVPPSLMDQASDYVKGIGKVFTDRQARGRQAMAEGLKDGRDASGTVTDPLAYAGSALKVVGGAFDASGVGAGLGTASEVLLGRPAEALTKKRPAGIAPIKAEDVGDFGEQVGSFLLPGGGAKAKAKYKPLETPIEVPPSLREAPAPAELPKAEAVKGPVTSVTPPTVDDVLGPAPWSKSPLRGVNSQRRGFLDPHPGPLGRYADALYRETNPETAAAMTPGTHINDAAAIPHYLSNDPDLASGQGDNRGVLMEYDAHKLNGIVDMQKPAAQFSLGEGSAEFQASHSNQRMGQAALKAVRVPLDLPENAILSRSLRTLENQGWTRTESNGYAEWRKPAPEVAAAEGPRLVSPAEQAKRPSGDTALGHATAPEVVASETISEGPRLVSPEEQAKRPTMAAAVEDTPEPTLEAPMHTGEGGPIVGDEADPVERLDNALHRLGGHKDTAKSEAMRFLDGNFEIDPATGRPRVDPETGMPVKVGGNMHIVGDQALQEELTHAVEQKMVDPLAEIPEHLQEAEALRAPWAERQRAAINRRRELGDPNAEDYPSESGYVPRYVEGHDPMLDEVDTGPSQGDPILGEGRGSLSTSSASAKERTAGWMQTDQDGQTFFSPTKETVDIKDRPYMSTRPATVAEVEANTGTRYNKNATVNTMRRALHDEAVVRHLEVLEELKKQLVGQNLAVRDFWYRKNAAGEEVRQRPKRGMGDNGGPALDADGEPMPAPRDTKDFRAVPHIPQLEGMRFAPEIAEKLEDAYKPEDGLLGALSKVNRALTMPMFITPAIHGMNVAAHWGAGRGFDWVRGEGWKSLLNDGTSAIHQVWTQGPIFRELMREGMGGQYLRTQTRDYHAAILKAAGKEMFSDPETANILAKAARLPVSVVRAAYNASSKALWYVNDVMLMQRVLELKRKGMSTREAIHEAEREIPNYRIPPRIGGTGAGAAGRLASQTLQTSAIGMFNRYKYGAARAWAALIKDLAKGDATQRKEAVGKLLVAITAVTVIAPAANWVAQKMTGNKNAKLRSAGGFSMTQSIADAATGTKDFSDSNSTFFSPGPLMGTAYQAWNNHDHFGNEIRTPGAPAGLQGAELAKFLATQGFYPGALAADTIAGKGDKAAGRIVGLSLPSDRDVAVRKHYDQRDIGRGRAAGKRFDRRLESGNLGDAITKLGKKR